MNQAVIRSGGAARARRHWRVRINAVKHGRIAVLMGALLVTAGISLAVPSTPINLVAVGLFLAIVHTTFTASRTFVLLMLPILFLKLSELLPCLMVEAGNSYMWETAQSASLTGATARLSLFDAIFLLAAFFAYQPFAGVVEGVIRNPRKLISRWVSAGIVTLGFLILAYFLAIGLLKGFPLITGAERFAFRRELGGIFDSVLNNRSLIVSLLALVQVRGHYRRYARPCAWLLILSCVLLGEKFTSVGLLICQYAAILLAFSPSRPLALRLSALTLGLAVLTLPAVMISFGVVRDPQSALVAFSDRVSLQSQLWFLADRHMVEAGMRFDPAALGAEIMALVNPAARGEGQFGLYYIMRPFADAGVYDFYLQDKVGFIFALLPSWLYAYGPIAAALLTIAAGVSMSVLTGCLFLALRARQSVFVVLLVKAMSWNLSAHIIGYSYLLFGIEPAIIVLALILVLASRRAKRGKRRAVFTASGPSPGKGRAISA